MMGRISSRSRTGRTGGRQSPEGVLLLVDHPLALVNEADRDGVRDPVRGGLVGIQHLAQQGEVALVLLEQRPGQDITQQEHDADHFMGLHAAGDDALGQVLGVLLQRLDAAGLQHLDVVVVDRGGLNCHLLQGHRLQQVGVLDAGDPLLAQLRAVLAQVSDQLGEQLVLVRSAVVGPGPLEPDVAVVRAHVHPS